MHAIIFMKLNDIPYVSVGMQSLISSIAYFKFPDCYKFIACTFSEINIS
jgi:hypothetical protein